MTFKLNRKNIFFIGLALTFVYLILNRLDYIFASQTTIGQVVEIQYEGGFSVPIINFSPSDTSVSFKGVANMNLGLGDIVSVVYKTNDPSNAEIYTFTGFWLTPLLYCLIPLMLLMAIVFSFLSKKQTFTIHIGKQIRLYKDNDTLAIKKSKRKSSKLID